VSGYGICVQFKRIIVATLKEFILWGGYLGVRTYEFPVESSHAQKATKRRLVRRREGLPNHDDLLLIHLDSCMAHFESQLLDVQRRERTFGSLEGYACDLKQLQHGRQIRKMFFERWRIYDKVIQVC
jgi:hypothetical protein